MDKIKHRELLRKWLRGKGFHINDISSALEYYNNLGSNCVDKDILEVAEKCHREAVDSKVKDLKGKPLIVKYVNKGRVWPTVIGWVILGSIFSIYNQEIKIWLLAMMQ